jgi:micrococcal nuclease
MIPYSARRKRNSPAAAKNRRFHFPAGAGIAILLVYLVWLVMKPGDPASPAAVSVTGPTLQEALMETAGHEVVRVVDGDTFIATVDGSRERVRLIGIDTPEAASAAEGSVRPAESGSLEATLRLEELLEGKRVFLVKDVSDRDSYGRLLRYAWLDAHTCVNLVLAEEGLAYVVRIPPDTALLEELRQTEKRAREAGLGLWSGK